MSPPEIVVTTNITPALTHVLWIYFCQPKQSTCICAFVCFEEGLYTFLIAICTSKIPFLHKVVPLNPSLVNHGISKLIEFRPVFLYGENALQVNYLEDARFTIYDDEER